MFLKQERPDTDDFAKQKICGCEGKYFNLSFFWTASLTH